MVDGRRPSVPQRLRAAMSGLRSGMDSALLDQERAQLESELRAEESKARKFGQRARAAERRMHAANSEAGELRTAYLDLSASFTDGAVPESASRRAGDRPPSFRYKLGEQRRIAAVLDAEHDIAEPVMSADAKLDGRSFAESLGVSVPQLLCEPTKLGEVPFDSLPDEFVLKPILGHSSRGVFLLRRVGERKFESLLDQSEIWTVDDIERRYQEWRAGSLTDIVIVEQLLATQVGEKLVAPVDWRFFCFYGKVGLVMGRDGHGYRAGSRVRFRFFDDEWNDQGVVRLDVRHDSGIELPDHHGEMMRTAERLSAAIPRAMVRIDLFSAPSGVYFGEVTPAPGGDFSLTDDQDRRLGELWEHAEARLAAEAIRSGLLDLRTTSSEVS